MSDPTRILLIDDDPLVRGAYRTFFSRQHDFTVCGEARNGVEGTQAYATLRPDIALMDLHMPVMSGIEATRQICERWPGACVVAMTTFGTREYVVEALRAGAAGYLLKDVAGDALLAGLRAALEGSMPLSGAVRRELVSSVIADQPPVDVDFADVGLTPRERELLGWLAQGLTNRQIGTQMFVSEGSVKQYLHQVSTKLGVVSRTAILIRAVQLKLVDPHALPSVQE